MFFSALVVILGLIIFEVITSIDNAIVNAHVLRTMPEKYRRIFLFWGILFAVFVVRGVLPFIIVWLTAPNLSIGELFHVVFSSGDEIEHYLEGSKPLLLLGGGVYLFFVFLSWLFLEQKQYAFFLEKHIHRQSVWFYAVASIFFTVVVYWAINVNPLLALSASIGSTLFFITDGFKKNAEEKEKEMERPNVKMSAWSKIMYLEALDTSFSIDGVIGAFAFTLSVPLILIGNGIGAIIVRQLTVKGIDTIARYAYLKNGAMYSVGVLGVMMVMESFGKEYPVWFAPLNTVVILAVFLFLSYREIRRMEFKST
jgi:hypothetical protein